MANKVLVFDLDDTLIDNVHDYTKPILDMAWFIIQALGSRAPHVSAIIALEQEIDLARRKEINPATGKSYGYAMARFPSSLVRTYEDICEKVGVRVEPAVSRQIHAVGMNAFDVEQYKRNIKPGALDVARYVLVSGDFPAILSAGDKRVQANKLSALRAGDIFLGGIHVVDKKTPDIFRGLMNNRRFRGCEFWSIGNNYDSDIAPALEVGYKGIWIPVETWETLGEMGKIRARADWSRCVELKDIRELAERYSEL